MLIRKVTWLSTHKINHSWKTNKREKAFERTAWKWNLNVHIIFSKKKLKKHPGDGNEWRRICITTWMRFTSLRWHGKVIKFNRRIWNVFFHAHFSLCPNKTDRRCEYEIMARPLLMPEKFSFRRHTSNITIWCRMRFSSWCVSEYVWFGWPHWMKILTQESKRILSGIESSDRNWIWNWFTYWIANTERIEARNAISLMGKFIFKAFSGLFVRQLKPHYSHMFMRLFDFIHQFPIRPYWSERMRFEKEYQGRKR